MLALNANWVRLSPNSMILGLLAVEGLNSSALMHPVMHLFGHWIRLLRGMYVPRQRSIVIFSLVEPQVHLYGVCLPH